MTNYHELPLFPLNTVLFPDMPLPLHVFEPRYLEMMDYCRRERMPFGVVLIQSGPEVGGPSLPFSIGTMARVTHREPLDSGSLNIVATGEGNGPVNALDRALREALVEIHPHLREIELVNFKVRILDETKGTGAVTRVLLDVSDGDHVWGSIGVSENVIEASWEALVDALEYGMQASHGHVLGKASGT